MVRKTCSPEQIINKLREAEVLISQRIPIAEASRKTGATEQTYYRWRRKYGGRKIEQAKRLKELEPFLLFLVSFLKSSQFSLVRRSEKGKLGSTY